MSSLHYLFSKDDVTFSWHKLKKFISLVISSSITLSLISGLSITQCFFFHYLNFAVHQKGTCSFIKWLFLKLSPLRTHPSRTLDAFYNYQHLITSVFAIPITFLVFLFYFSCCHRFSVTGSTLQLKIVVKLIY